MTGIQLATARTPAGAPPAICPAQLADSRYTIVRYSVGALRRPDRSSTPTANHAARPIRYSELAPASFAAAHLVHIADWARIISVGYVEMRALILSGVMWSDWPANLLSPEVIV
jgi:hypothetical protein